MKFAIRLTLVASVLLSLQACMTPIGKEEFACPNQKKGGVCAGPRDIYELTNSRTNLENLADDENYDGYAITTDEKGRTVATKREKSSNSTSPSAIVKAQSDPTGTDVTYEPREHTQHTANNHQPATVIPQIRNTPSPDDAFSAWPRSTEPLAPEPLAVLEPPKIMRVLVSSYKDARGNLNMPGYVFVQVEAETWSIGEAANIRPQRVVPSQVIEKTNAELQSQQNRQQGVSPIETLNRAGGQ